LSREGRDLAAPVKLLEQQTKTPKSRKRGCAAARPLPGSQLSTATNTHQAKQPKLLEI
jgi:hypothetical protein